MHRLSHALYHGPVFGHETLHDEPSCKVSYRAIAKNNHVAGLLTHEAQERQLYGLHVVEQMPRHDIDEERAYTTCHAVEAGDSGNGAFGEQVAAYRVEVGRP